VYAIYPDSIGYCTVWSLAKSLKVDSITSLQRRHKQTVRKQLCFFCLHKLQLIE